MLSYELYSFWLHILICSLAASIIPKQYYLSLCNQWQCRLWKKNSLLLHLLGNNDGFTYSTCENIVNTWNYSIFENNKWKKFACKSKIKKKSASGWINSYCTTKLLHVQYIHNDKGCNFYSRTLNLLVCLLKIIHWN